MPDASLIWLVFAHVAPPISPGDWWKAWNLEPAILVLLALAAVIYLAGTSKVWHRAGIGHGINRRRWLSFLGAMLALIVAFISPLDAMSHALFSAHMVQHLVLMLIAAPLLVMSDFHLAFLWALPRRQAQTLGQSVGQSRVLGRTWDVLSNPVFAWFAFTVSMWLWHAPLLFQAALRNETVHVVEHASFLLTSMLYWWVLFRPTVQKHRHFGLAIPYLFTTVLQSGILGALMTFSSRSWYPDYAASVARWGLTPLADQQLAGLIMWVPGGTVFTLLTIGYFAAWLRILEQRSVKYKHRDILPSDQKLK